MQRKTSVPCSASCRHYVPLRGVPLQSSMGKSDPLHQQCTHYWWLPMQGQHISMEESWTYWTLGNLNDILHGGILNSLAPKKFEWNFTWRNFELIGPWEIWMKVYMEESWTHWPLGIWIKFYISNFKANFDNWWQMYILWNCPEMIIIGPY